MTFKALVTAKTAEGVSNTLTDRELADIGEGDVTVAVEYSTVNYKDGLALSGGRIMQSMPMIGGIDLAGTVEASDNPAFKAGDKVILNGWGLSQTHNGGYAQKARVPGGLADPAAGQVHDARSDGDRHGGLYGDAVRDGAGA